MCQPPRNEIGESFMCWPCQLQFDGSSSLLCRGGTCLCAFGTMHSNVQFRIYFRRQYNYWWISMFNCEIPVVFLNTVLRGKRVRRKCVLLMFRKIYFSERVINTFSNTINLIQLLFLKTNHLCLATGITKFTTAKIIVSFSITLNLYTAI